MGELITFFQNYPNIRDFNDEMTYIISQAKGKCSVLHIFERLEINEQFLIDLYNDLPCFEETRKVCGDKLEIAIPFSNLSSFPNHGKIVKKVIREIYFELIRLAKIEEESFFHETKEDQTETKSDSNFDESTRKSGSESDNSELVTKYFNLPIDNDTVDVGNDIHLPKVLIKSLASYLKINDFDSIVYGISNLKPAYKKYLLEEWDPIGREFQPLYKPIYLSSDNYDDYDEYFETVKNKSLEKAGKQTFLFKIFSCLTIEAKKMYLIKKLPIVFSLSDEKVKKLLSGLTEEEQNEVYGLLLEISMLDTVDEEKVAYGQKIPFVIKKRILALQK